jgi:hypothetical protein
VSAGAAVFPIRPARSWRRLGILLSTVAAAALGGWAWRLVEQAQWGEAGVVFALGMLVIASGRRPAGAEGRLMREGGLWAFEPAARPPARRSGDLVVSIDLGDWMLLHFRPDGARRWRGRVWFALSRGDMPASWPAFRRAVYSPRPSPAGLSAQAPADPPA